MSFVSPLVGITGRTQIASAMGSPYSFATAPLDVYLSEYAESVTRAGGLPVHLPLGVDSRVLDRLDALVLVGGGDIDPRRYGQAPHPQVGDIDPRRDDFEFGLLAKAMDLELPVLAICRGMQLVNVHLGGTLIQHLEGGEAHGAHIYPRATRVHAVTTEPDSIARRCYGPRARVNSFHHQGIDQLGDGLVVTALADDGVIEAVQSTRHPIAGVQWHPEVFLDDPIFTWFIKAAAQRNLDERTTA